MSTFVWIVVFCLLSIFIGYYLKGFTGNSRIAAILFSGYALHLANNLSGISYWYMIIPFLVLYAFGLWLRSRLEK